MADTIFTSQTPNAPPDSGGVTNRSIAMRAQISASGKQSTTARYWVPATGLGATSLFYIWDLTTSTRLVEVNLNSVLASPTLDDFNQFSLGSTVSWQTSHDYAIGIYLDGASSYRYSSGQTLPVGSGGVISADTAIYRDNGTHDDAPSTVFPGGFFFIDVNVEDASTAVTAAFTAAPATFTAAGTSINPAASAVTAGAATLSAAGTSINPAASAVTAAAATMAAAGSSINPATAAFTASAATGSATGTSINAAIAVFTAAPARFHATDVVTQGPAVLTPGGTSPGLTAGGTTPVLSPSGLP